MNGFIDGDERLHRRNASSTAMSGFTNAGERIHQRW
jgi:hypothetical protein